MKYVNDGKTDPIIIHKLNKNSFMSLRLIDLIFPVKIKKNWSTNELNNKGMAAPRIKTNVKYTNVECINVA